MRKSEVLAVTGFSDTTLWREEKAGRFPSKKQISTLAVGYLYSEVKVWMDNLKNVTSETSNSNLCGRKSPGRGGRKSKAA
jgi:prophage regulatory protein